MFDPNLISRMLIAGLIRACLGASMTIQFPLYKGDRDKLEKLVKLSGSLASDLNQQATNMDELVSDEHLIMLTRNLAHYEDFGAMLSELSVSRFDSFCEKNAKCYKTGYIAEGYPHEQSFWKQHLCLPSSKHDPEVEWCKGNDAKAILSPLRLHTCLKTWDPERAREGHLESPILHKLHRIRARTFHDHPDMYLQVLEKYVEGGGVPTRQFWLPRGIAIEHLERFKSILKKAKPFRQPYFKPLLDSNIALVEAINRDGLFVTISGFDPEPFEGQWPVPNEIQDKGLASLHNDRPLYLYWAFEAYYHFGNRQVLEKSLELSRLAADGDQKRPLVGPYSVLESWLCSPHPFTARVVDLIDIVRPKLKVSARYHQHLLPLVQWILAKEPGYYEDHIIEWAQKFYTGMWGNGTEDDYIRNIDYLGPNEAACLAISKGWSRVLAIVAIQDEFDIPLNYQSMSLLLKGTERRIIDRLVAKALGSIAISANIKLLDLLLDAYKPPQLLAMTGNRLVQHRLSLMLHISPKTTSISKHGGSVVDRQSLEFRRWLMLNLPCKQFKVADMKLLYHYF